MEKMLDVIEMNRGCKDLAVKMDVLEKRFAASKRALNKLENLIKMMENWMRDSFREEPPIQDGNAKCTERRIKDERGQGVPDAREASVLSAVL
jgi:hypothetical protein